MRRIGLAAGAAVCLAVCLAAGPALLPQEVEDVTGAIEKYRGLVALATQKLEDLDLPEALARFTEVIDGYNAGKLPAATPLTRQIVGQAYEGRARTHANLGQSDRAEADFEALIRFDVSWPIDRTRTSPKIVALYDKVRRRIVGSLALQTEPAGAVVSINGEAIGRTPLFDRELAAGGYEMRLEAPGFDPIVETIALKGGDRLERSLRLRPNARSLLVATSPAGARIHVDGAERGATFGSAGPEYAEVASRLGLALADLSAPLLVEHLKPGQHQIRVEKECHEPQLLTVSVSIQPEDNAPVRLEPVRLAPSLGSLSIDSSPAGAEVLLDGRPAGRAPLKLEGVCSGAHTLTLRVAEVGQWIGGIQVTRGQRTAVNERLRMTLAYVGMTVPGPANEAPAGEEELGRLLAQVGTMNLVAPGAGLPDALLARRQAPAADPQRLGDGYIDAVHQATGADLVLAAHPAEGAFERRFEVLIYSARRPFKPLEDRLQLSLDGASGATGAETLLARLQAPISLTRPWLGLDAIELHRAPNPIVVRVQPDSPAARAGVRLGDAVVSLGGRPVGVPGDLAKILSGLREGAQASLTLQSPGAAPRQANVAIGSSPFLHRSGEAGGSTLRSRFVAEMAFRGRLGAALGKEMGQEPATALLNLGVALLEAGQPQAALAEAFGKVTLADGVGISGGTVSYLKGLCLSRLGRLPEARQEFTKAASQNDATLWAHDGSPVAERARRLLGSL